MALRNSNLAASRGKGVGNTSVYAKRPGEEDTKDSKKTRRLKLLGRDRRTKSKAAYRKGTATAYTRHHPSTTSPSDAVTSFQRNTKTGSRTSATPKGPAKNADAQQNSGKATRSRFSIAPGYIMLWSFIFGICGYAYITHVFTTQRLLVETREARQELERTELLYENRALQFEQMSGPAEVLRRAGEMELENFGPVDYVIEPGQPVVNQSGRE
jgi:hypothetical protein